MIYRHSDKQVQEYYGRTDLNQSSIKAIINKGIHYYLSNKENIAQDDDLYYEEKRHFILGQGVDTLITMGQESFDSKFHVSDLSKKPGATIMSIIKLAFDKACAANGNSSTGILPIEFYKHLIYEACNEEQYFTNRIKSNWEEDTRITTVLKDNAAHYWAELTDACGKQILTKEEYQLINLIVQNLTNHDNTRWIFEEDNYTDIIYQYPMFWEYEGINCKGLIDMITIDHKSKVIYAMDIKTTLGHILNFTQSVKIRRYDIQASFYLTGLSYNLHNLSELIGKDLSNYEIAKFAFIVESTTHTGLPIVFPLGNDLITVGMCGSEKENLKGWMDAITTYKSWQNHDFDLKRRISDLGGFLVINQDFKYQIPNLF